MFGLSLLTSTNVNAGADSCSGTRPCLQLDKATWFMSPVTAGLVFIVNPCLCAHFSVNTLKSNVSNCRGPTSNGLKGSNDNQQPVPSTLAVVFCLPVSSQPARVVRA